MVAKFAIVDSRMQDSYCVHDEYYFVGVYKDLEEAQKEENGIILGDDAHGVVYRYAHFKPGKPTRLFLIGKTTYYE